LCREVPIRVAFQALQLVVTDFMPLLPHSCLPLCIQTAARFGTQLVELNISLTAIGLLVSQWLSRGFLLNMYMIEIVERV
jgi:hypothetical protein